MSRRLWQLVAAPAAALAGLVVLVGPAQADTPAQRAAALAARVADLQQRAEVATEAYDQAEGELGIVVTEASLARDHAEAARTAITTKTDAADAQARALYMLGGSGPLYAQVFTQSSGALDLHTNLLAARDILGRSDAAAKAAVDASAAADRASAAADTLANEQLRLEAQVTANQATIQQALAQTQQALAAANAEVRALAIVAAQQQTAARNAAFTSTLTAAQLASLAGSGPASSPVAAQALAVAESLQGHPYQYGGTGPNTYDCSGMTGAAYAAAGIHLPRTAAQQYQAGPHVALADLRPGDLLFWATDLSNAASIHHVAIYAGSGMMVSANHTGDVVRLQKVWWDGYFGATRPDPAAALAVPGPRWAPGQTS